MARAMVAGNRYNVRVVQDLADNWSLELYPAPDEKRVKTSEPFKNWPVPLCIKVRADSREDALSFGLEHMKRLGKIDGFELAPEERAAPPSKGGSAPPVKPTEGGES